jgi:hypothetical protein
MSVGYRLDFYSEKYVCTQDRRGGVGKIAKSLLHKLEGGCRSEEEPTSSGSFTENGYQPYYGGSEDTQQEIPDEEIKVKNVLGSGDW